MKNLTRRAPAFAALSLLTLLSACGDPYSPGVRAGNGAVIGGGTGAAIGALAGGGHGAAIGALAGGLLGAGTGALTTPNRPQTQGYSGYPQQQGTYYNGRQQGAYYPQQGTAQPARAYPQGNYYNQQGYSGQGY